MLLRRGWDHARNDEECVRGHANNIFPRVDYRILQTYEERQGDLSNAEIAERQAVMKDIQVKDSILRRARNTVIRTEHGHGQGRRWFTSTQSRS